MTLHSEELVVECIDICKRFGTRYALRNINAQVGRGTVTAIVGSNGAGKTTLLKILATLLKPSAGVARILGVDVLKNPHQIKNILGYVSSEERSFYWRLTGRQNLNFFARLYGLDRSVSNRRIDALLEALGFEGLAEVPVRECSSGMKQVLGIVRGMLHDPPVLLLDEPTRSLAPDTAIRARQLIRQEAEKGRRTVLIASHNLGEVESIADEIFILHGGVIQASGSLRSLCLSAAVEQESNLERVFQYYIEKSDKIL